MCMLINDKMSHEKDFDRILEWVEFDVKEMIDSPSLIEDDGSIARLNGSRKGSHT